MKVAGQKSASDRLQRLRRRVEAALRVSLDPRGLLPLLHELSRVSPPSSDDAAFAHQLLAELLAEVDPWRAALYARRVVRSHPDNHRAWAALGLTQSLLENFRFARRAYERALELSPKNASYAHNLGHLLDVALHAPDAAVVWLGRAYQWAKADVLVVASYAHALGRVGRWKDAARVLRRSAAKPSRELRSLAAWVEAGLEGASKRADVPAFRPLLREHAPKSRRAPPSGATRPAMEKALRRGLSHLPLTPDQRDRALDLALDAARARFSASHAGSVDTIAAAIAYAIVFVDEVPLTHAEVAAPFRVRVAEMRGCFAELRAELSIVRGDGRYAT
jgi:hypothetical protein